MSGGKEDLVKFRMLDWKLKSPSDTVVFELEDGTIVKIKVDLDRAAIAIDYKNPDGTPHYNIGTGLKLTVVPKSKEIMIPKSQLNIPPQPSKQHPSVV